MHSKVSRIRGFHLGRSDCSRLVWLVLTSHGARAPAFPEFGRLRRRQSFVFDNKSRANLFSAMKSSPTTTTSFQTTRIRKGWEERGETTIRTIFRQHTGGVTGKKDPPEWMKFIRSCRRPGVAITSCEPARRLWICAFSDTPPIRSAALGSLFVRSCSYCSWTCIASSRVGSNTRATV
jgi:hypothetical protein